MMFQRLKQLMRLYAATEPPKPAPPIIVSEDLEMAEFRLLASDRPNCRVHVSVEALAILAGTQVRSPEQAVALVRDQMPKLEAAAMAALGRGEVVDGVILLKPQDLAP